MTWLKNMCHKFGRNLTFASTIFFLLPAYKRLCSAKE